MRTLALATAGIAVLWSPDSGCAQTSPLSDALLTKARAAASAVPGALPRELRFLKFGELTAPLRELVENAGDSLVVAAVTVFQIRYRRGWIMVDAGMNRDVDTSITFWPSQFARVQQALRGANLILVTHEHHDHVAEVVRTSTLDLIAPKTLLNRSQVQTLIERPNSPLIQLTPARAHQYLVIDYDPLYPVAPGVVLIRAPGHTSGSQMVYVRLASGNEALFIGDIVWMMAGLESRVQKPRKASEELSEDRAALQQQIDWLSGLTARQGVVLINCHDDTWLRSLVRRGILKEDLDLTVP
jgi:glyoxylase-like metal-dependent hydrolase (beta-lactamase superfamily II)